MNESKIQLSEEETALVKNSQWILTKHSIIEKVYQMFGDASVIMQEQVQNYGLVLPEELAQTTPKISKGEMYKQLPYVVLDYPRFFSKEHVFAIRSFFWWGKYFAVTLHLKGRFKQICFPKLADCIATNQFSGYYIAIEGDEFNFDLDNKQYHQINRQFQWNSIEVKRSPFIKVSKKISFEQWNLVPENLSADFKSFIELAVD